MDSSSLGRFYGRDVPLGPSPIKETSSGTACQEGGGAGLAEAKASEPPPGYTDGAGNGFYTPREELVTAWLGE